MRSLEHDERSRALSLVAERVRIRFGLDAGAFLDHLLALPAGPGSPGEAPVDQRPRRLSLDDLYLAAACVRGDEAA